MEMNTLDILRNPAARWEREPPAEPEVVRKLVAESKVELPADYIALLRYSNGGEGQLGVEPGWFQLWPAEKVIEFNQDYEVAANAPGFFGFGSSGGGEMLAFDTRGNKPWKVVMMPFMPMQAEDAVVIEGDFSAFLQSMGQEFGGSHGLHAALRSRSALGTTNVRTIEKLLIGAILGAIFPILGFLAVWWGTLAFLPDKIPFLIAFVGLLIGILVDIAYLRRWVGSAYSISLKIWMAVYLFYSIGMFGFFMGAPVFNVILAVPAGLFMGSKLARQTADHDAVRRMSRNTCLFTTGVLAVVCAISAVIALVDPYTGLDLQRMLGLQFEVTRWMLAGVIAIGGIALLVLQWGITGKVIHLTYALQTNGSALR